MKKLLKLGLHFLVNVRQLGGAWHIHLENGDASQNQQSTIVAQDGILYVQTSQQNVFAADGSTGAVQWKTNVGKRPTNMRGVAVADGMVFTTSGDNIVYALERGTAKARWAVMDYFRFSDRVGPAFQESLAQKSKFDRAMGARSLQAQDDKYAFAPCHVPQLLWQADFEAHFSNFFREVSDHFARRFCAMSLVKLCGDYTWGEAATMLGLPEHHGIKLANRCVGFLADEHTKKRFGLALHTLAKRLSADPAEVANRCLKDDGLFLLHTIGKNQRDSIPDPWIEKYILPNGDLPSIGQIGDAICTAVCPTLFLFGLWLILYEKFS